MAGIIGKKLGMTGIFDEEGRNIPCTVIEAGPCYVTQVKSADTDGYESVQLSFGNRRQKSTNKPMTGHYKKAGVEPKRIAREFRQFQGDVNIGDEVKTDIFAEGEFVDVTGLSKGKGFQGVVKRHGFAGVGGSTHGQHNRQRAPGSLGASSFPSRVFKGMRMAGRKGNSKVKVQNLRVVRIIADKNLILLKGAVPGPKGGYIYIEK